jgi:hypothetical protein
LATTQRATLSVLTYVHYVTLQIKLDEEKWEHASLDQHNAFGLEIFHSFAEAGKRHSKA